MRNFGKHVKIYSAMLALSMLGMAFFNVTVPISGSPTIVDAAPIPGSSTIVDAHYGWLGYNGNNSIYLTSGFATNLHNFTGSSSAKTTYPAYSYPLPAVHNSLSIGIASSFPGNSGINFSFSEQCMPNGVLGIYIPVVLSGIEFINGTASCHSGMSLKTLYSLCGIPSDNARTNIQYSALSGYDYGLNISGERGPYTRASGASGLILPGAEDNLAGYSQSPTLNTFYNDNGKYYPGEQAGCVKNFVDNGTFNATDGDCGHFLNKFSSRELFHVCIPNKEFGNTGQINIAGENFVTPRSSIQCEETGCSIMGATASLKIPMVPAYTIGGQVKDSSGKGLPNQKVLIRMVFPEPEATKCVDYVVNTSASGSYEFFAAPGYQYNISLCSDPGHSQCLSASSTNNEGSNTGINFIVSSATFYESGFPSGTSWSAAPGSTLIKSSAKGTMFFNFGDEMYSHSSGLLTVFTISAQPKGLGGVSGLGYNSNITLNDQYTVAFGKLDCQQERLMDHNFRE